MAAGHERCSAEDRFSLFSGQDGASTKSIVYRSHSLIGPFTNKCLHPVFVPLRVYYYVISSPDVTGLECHSFGSGPKHRPASRTWWTMLAMSLDAALPGGREWALEAGVEELRWMLAAAGRVSAQGD